MRAAVKHSLLQASGKDGIPQSVVAKAPLVIGPSLMELFNASFACCIFLEIVGFLEEFSLLDSLQTGFCKFNSTPIALIKRTDEIRIRIDRMFVDISSFFFDFSIDFHTITPSKLLVS